MELMRTLSEKGSIFGVGIATKSSFDLLMKLIKEPYDAVFKDIPLTYMMLRVLVMSTVVLAKL